MTAVLFLALVVRSASLPLPAVPQPASGAQQAADSARDHEIIRHLLERVQQLEAEVKDLREHRAAGASPTTAASAQAAPSPQAAGSATPAQGQAMGMMATQTQPDDYARMHLRGFSDVDYHATDNHLDTNTFGFGQFNLFITSRLSDKLSFLAETVLEADTHNSVGVDLERVLLQYSPSDYFNVSFGRYHTAIGWYNTAYHHSTWMQTAVGRPFLFEFEDKGGILPIHNVGISATGKIPSDGLGLRYVAEIGNGRAARSPLDEPVQNIQDENNGKAVNFALLARPDGLPGFEAGFSVYHDNLTPAGSPNISQTIMAAHAVYQSPVFEWLNEALVLRNSIAGTGTVLHTPAFYTQLSRKFGAVRPYFRFQYMNVPPNDPLYKDVGLLYGPSFGMRWDFSEFAAFKLQYDRNERRNLAGFNGISTQLSFTF